MTLGFGCTHRWIDNAIIAHEILVRKLQNQNESTRMSEFGSLAKITTLLAVGFILSNDLEKSGVAGTTKDAIAAQNKPHYSSPVSRRCCIR